MFSTPFAFIDVETTGMSPRRGGRVLELGVIRVENGEIVSEMNILINPGVHVPQFITGITGITNEDIVESPYFLDIAQEFDSITQDAIFVAHNVGFDYGFLLHEMALSGVSYQRPRLCTVKLSRALYPGAEGGHSLGALINRHDYRVNARHRAYEDAHVLHRFVSDSLSMAPDLTTNTIKRLIQ